MAAVGGIQDEVTCPLCLDHFTDPLIIIECGPNLCQSCRTRYWEELENAGASCPQYRETDQQRNLIPNGYLKNVFEIVKKLCLWGQGKVERVCEMHKEPLKLFCKVHQLPICLMCQGSKEHQSHQVVPLEEAFQEYKDQIDSRLKNLTADKEKIMTYKADAEKESQHLLDVRRTLERSEKKATFENPVVFPPVLNCRIREFRNIKLFLKSVMKQFPADGIPVKLPLLYTAGTSQLISDIRGAPNGQELATKPGPGPIDRFGASSSIAGSMAQPAFDSSTAQAPFGGSNSLASFRTRSTTDQPVFGATAPTFKTTTTSAVSGFGATTQTTSSNTGSIFGSSTPFQFTFRWPRQPAAADLSPGSAIGAAPFFGPSPAQLLLGNQKQDSLFSFSNPGTIPESKTAFGGAPTSTFGQGSPTSGWSTAGNPPSGGVPVTSASGGSGSTFEFKTPTFCIGTDFKTPTFCIGTDSKRSIESRYRQRLQIARHRTLEACKM